MPTLRYRIDLHSGSQAADDPETVYLRVGNLEAHVRLIHGDGGPNERLDKAERTTDSAVGGAGAIGPRCGIDPTGLGIGSWWAIPARTQIKLRSDAGKWSGDMDDMVAFITGGGSGIGQAAAKLLARRGAKVALAGRTPDELAEVAEAIGGAGGTAITVTCDVSDEDSVRSAIATTVETWGRLDVVVANAGVNGTWAGIEKLAVEEFRSTLDINLVGTFTTIKYAVPHLRRRGGSVIVTSSVNGTRIFSNSGASAYSSSKAGQVALAKMLAVELGPDKIRVNVICPGAISTEIGDNTNTDNDDVKIPVEYPEGNIPLTGGKSGSAEQVGELIAFLASDEASHISGTEIWIDGAQSLLQG